MPLTCTDTEPIGHDDQVIKPTISSQPIISERLLVMAIRTEALWEVHRIIERKGGATFKTEYVEDRWVNIVAPLGRPDNNSDLIWVCKSTSYTDPTFRTVKE